MVKSILYFFTSGPEIQNCREDKSFLYFVPNFQVEKHGGKKTMEIFCRPVFRPAASPVQPSPDAPLTPVQESTGSSSIPLQVQGYAEDSVTQNPTSESATWHSEPTQEILSHLQVLIVCLYTYKLQDE